MAAAQRTGGNQAVSRALSSTTSGQPLPRPVRSLMESRFGADLGHVRIHSGGEASQAARAAEARAFTIGSEIVFGSGEYAPGTTDGQRLLAHELAHTQQQRRSVARPAAKLEASTPGDATEKEADRVADSVVAGQTIPPITSNPPGSAPQLARDEKPAAENAAPKPEEKKPEKGNVELSVLRKMVLDTILPDVMGAAFHGKDEAGKKWKTLGDIDMVAMRKQFPGYTTCGVLVQYVLKQLFKKLGIEVKDSKGILGGGLSGVFRGVRVEHKSKEKDAQGNPIYEPVRVSKNLSVNERKATAQREAQELGTVQEDGRNLYVYKGGAPAFGEGVWIRNSDGNTKRPRPGDIYVLEGYRKPQGDKTVDDTGIKHIGIFIGAKVNSDKTESWETADAGQGMKEMQTVVYSRKQKTAGGGEQDARIYDPADRTITGKADKGRVLGWIDLDLLVKGAKDLYGAQTK